MTQPPDRELAVFSASRRLSAGERSAYLDEACAGDAALRGRVEQLLEAGEEAGAFLEDPAEGAGRPAVALASPNSLPDAAATGEETGDKSQSRSIRQFGDYELLEEIARGGMGIVFKARQRKLDRLVAVKMILGGEFASREQALRFRAEVEAAARLQHPNIVRIHETGEQDGQPYFSMDYVQGGNLATLVREKPLPAKRAAGCVRTIAEAIHYAHEQGILHRDLKPSNVLIDSNDQPRVTDFGLAKRMQKESFLTITGDVMGSPNFMPPEQAGAKTHKAGRYSDVYSLGGILFYLVTGRPPFVAENVAETLHHVLNTEPVSPRLLNPSVPEDVATICLKCLEKEPIKRYQTTQQVAEELGRFLRDEPILARSASGPDFNQTQWASPEFAHVYLDRADEIVPLRRYLFQLLFSFLNSFRSAVSLRICDLGCGDGTLGEKIRALANDTQLTLVDGSAEMLETARRRLGESSNIRFIQAGFDAVIRGDVQLGPFEFIVSSFAIHHLDTTERTALLFRALQQLEPGGWFLNIDVGLPDSTAFTEWQFDLWREQIADRKRQHGGTSFPGDVVSLPYADRSFSIVTCRYALHHMESPAAVVSEMVRVCAPGGRVVLADMYASSNPVKAAAFNRMEKQRDGSHVRTLPRVELEALLHAAGLQRLHLGFYGLDWELETILQGSSITSEEAKVIRQLFAEDLESDLMSVNTRRQGSSIWFTYPIVVMAAEKPREP